MGDLAGSTALLAGAGKAAIELADILPFDGFDEPRHPVHARAVVLEAGGARACVVSLEMTSIRGDLMEALRAAATEESGCEGAYLWVCVTHTFSVPHVRTASHLASDEEREKNKVLLAAYVDAVRQAVRQAVAALAPATLSVASGPFTGNVNRDVETPGGWWLGANPDGYSDHTLRALRVDGEDGAPVAVLFSADVQSSILDHSTTSGGSHVVTGDLTGFAAGRVEGQLSGCVALYVIGCAGDQAPVEQAVTRHVAADGTLSSTDAHEDGYRMLHQQGARLTEELLAAIQDATPVTCDSIAAECHELTLPGQERAEFHSLAPKRSYEYLPADPVTTKVHGLRLGSVVLVGVEPELASATGRAIRTAAPCAYADVLTMVNGGAKYLPDDASYDKITYEAMNSGFARGAEQLLIEDVLSTMARLSPDQEQQPTIEEA